MTLIALDELIRTDKRDAAYYSDDELLNLIEKASVELAQLRADNEQKEKAYRLAVAECVKACKERDMHRRNWKNTMEHRDRLSAELEEALNLLKPLAYKKNVEDVNYFDLVAVTHFVEEHTEPMR